MITGLPEMSDVEKKWIDTASYETLLRRWRHSPSGDPIFQGESGAYYKKIMEIKRKQVGNDSHVAASKKIGWN